MSSNPSFAAARIPVPRACKKISGDNCHSSPLAWNLAVKERLSEWMSAPVARSAFQDGSLDGIVLETDKSLDDLFLHTLQDIYYAENQIMKSLLNGGKSDRSRT